MKAAFIHKYGGPETLETGKLAAPEQGDLEVLVQVKATSVNPVDWKARNGLFRWVSRNRFPRILGSDFAGIVESSDDPEYKPGAEVWGFVKPQKGGAHAEKVVIDAQKLGRKPENLDFEEASALPLVGISALLGLQKLGEIKPEQRVLINGASGGVGHVAVQMAKAFGAHVTAVCSGRNADFARLQGADEVIDYTRESIEGSGNYNLIFDTIGNLSYGKLKPFLKKKGIFVTAVPSVRVIIRSFLTRMSPGRRLRFVVVKCKHQDLESLRFLVEQGSLKPYIEHAYSFEEIREAYAHNEEGRTRGKVVIKMD